MKQKMTEQEILAKIRGEIIAKHDPNCHRNYLLDEKKNEMYEGVAISGVIDPASNWYKENAYLLMDLSLLHGNYGNNLSERIDNEIVKPINDYLFEKTGKHYVHEAVPNYKGYANVPGVYDQLFHKVIEEIDYGLNFDFDEFAKEYIEENKGHIDKQIENKEILKK